MNEKPLADVPSLDSLVADPGKVVELPPEVARTLLIGLATLQPILIYQSLRDTGKAEAHAAPERFLTVEEVISQYGLTARWIYRHKKQLPHSQPSRKVLLFPEEKLQRWFASRKTG